MKTEHLVLQPLASLERWDRNYRVGDVPSIIGSIVRFGFNSALRVWNGRVMAGNHSLIAIETMRANGAKPPRGITVGEDGDWLIPTVDLSHLSQVEAAAFAVADNRTHDLGQDDVDRLTELLKEFAADPGGLEGTGYSQDDLDQLLKSLNEDVEFKEFDDKAAEDVKQATCPKCGATFPL